MTSGIILALAIIVAAIVIFIATLLFITGVILLGVGAYSWSEATRVAHRARAHGAQADEQIREVEIPGGPANDDEMQLTAQARAAWEPPTDGDLEAAIIAERIAERTRAARVSTNSVADITTTSNEGIPEQPPIPEGGMYRNAGDGPYDTAGFDHG